MRRLAVVLLPGAALVTGLLGCDPSATGTEDPPPPPPPPPALADLAVDTNRDGVIDADDESGEDTWTEARGAVFLSNWDDDDGDGEQDARDNKVNGAEDARDMARVLVRRSPSLPKDAEVTLEVSPSEAAARVRLFAASDYKLLLDVDLGTATLSADTLREEDIEVLLEGVGGRSARWDGRVTLTLRVKKGDKVLADDVVELRAAPTIFPDNTQPAERLYVMRITDRRLGENRAFYSALVEHLPGSVTLYDVDQYAYGADRWVQDAMQTGYQQVPSEDGPRTQLVYFEAERDAGWGPSLQELVPFELLGANLGYAYTGGAETSLNYGGNLEVTPPYEHEGKTYRFGRVFVGGGNGGTILGSPYADHMNPDQLGYLNAQEVQGPVFELSSEWLAVGHIDEVLLFVPDLGRPERPWRVVFASPTLARTALERVYEHGNPNAVVFAGREVETTVRNIIEDDDLLAYNDAVQARLDSIRDRLTAEMGLTDEDIIEVPVLFEPLYYGGYDFGIAYNPGMQNLVVADDILFVPDPEGPVYEGEDVWRRVASENLAPTGNTVHYVDVFDSYHLLMGEAHCGTNVRHAPYAEEWWTP